MRPLHHRLLAISLFTALGLMGPRATAVVLQIDGTIVPVTTAIVPGLNKGENGCPNPSNSSTCYNVTSTPPTVAGAGPKGPIDRIFDAAEQPQVFQVPVDDQGRFGIVDFIDLLEGAGFENTFGWYNVGDDLSDLDNLHSVLTCSPTNYEATPNTNSQRSVDFQAEYTAGRYGGGFIGFFLTTPEDVPGNCGNPANASSIGRIYYTEKAINGDGNYVHYLIYKTKVTDEYGVPLNDYYFGFEDLYRGGDNDFEDMLIFVRGLVTPCEPSSEICDGLDNNCDGLVDNEPVDSGGTCVTLPGNTGVGECQSGQWECASTGPGDTTQLCVGEQGPVAESCNGLDDNCDGQTDNPTGGIWSPPLSNACAPIYANAPCSASTECVAGRVTCVVAQGPEPEVCNGIDDDCDGVTDDDPTDVGSSCTPSPTSPTVGECHAGEWVCDGGDRVCSGYQGPGTEVCDNKDNDCDGTIDEVGGMADVGQQCTPDGLDVCAPGTTQCVGGALICSGFDTGGPETCNGVDDDCDGVIDDSPLDVGGPCGQNRGDCEPGQLECQPVVPGDLTTDELTCVGGVGPSQEECDGRDNDCDGVIDGPGLMPGEGDSCTGSCGAGLMQCTGGQLVCVGSSPSREVCNGIDDDCDGKIDEASDLPEVGIACFVDDIQLLPPCQPGRTECVQQPGGGAEIECVGATQGTAEECNGLDDDCDGTVDGPGFMPGEATECLTPCGPGLRHCRGGLMVCETSTAGTREVCNGIDDDCDGLTDEDTDLAEVGIACFEDDIQLYPPCQPGRTACVPQSGGGAEIECVDAVLGTAEECNGIDDDCDGTVDGPGQMPGEGEDCETDCGPGSLHCRGGEMVCESDAGTREVCNGVDDDCDGEVDEETDLAEVGIACFADEDRPYPPCQPGRTECVDDGDGGATIECVGATEGSDEVCDGLDNDCDGIIDNGMFDEAGQPCLTDVLEELFGDLDPDEDLPGECQRGTLACVQGSTDDGDVTGEIGCIGAVEPTDEICDGKDNDCDGEADTPDPCPGESQCIAGRCTEPCTVMGEFVICPGGQVCNSDGFCVPKEQAGSGGTTGASGDAGATAGPDGVEGSAGSGADDAEGAAGSGVVDSETGGAPSRPDTSSAGHDSSNPAWDSDGDGKRDEYALATGGGGCGCRLGPAPDARGVTLGILLLGLLGRLKRRRRRTTRARRAAA